VKRFGSCCLLVLTAGGCFLAVSRLDAASFTLTPEQRDDAIRMGKRSVVSGAFDAEWSVSGAGAGQALMVMTPFHRLALAVRNSAFKSQELKPQDVEALLKEQAGTLTLWAMLRGGTADFARFYTPLLVSGREQIKPSFTQNERTARREDDGSYTARCMYVFPSGSLKPNDTVTLIVKGSDDKQVAKFTVDLSAMR
jgi:hypothetical protein